MIKRKDVQMQKCEMSMTDECKDSRLTVTPYKPCYVDVRWNSYTTESIVTIGIVDIEQKTHTRLDELNPTSFSSFGVSPLVGDENGLQTTCCPLARHVFYYS